MTVRADTDRGERMTEGQGLSQGRRSRVHEALARHVESGEVPGAVAMVRRGGDTHVEVIGARSRTAPDPVRRDSIFRISSMTKPITAAATMILVQESRLFLDESVDRLLPELADRRVLRAIDAQLDDTVPATRPITVRDLLSFTMGIGVLPVAPDSYPIQRAMSELELGQGPPHPASVPAPDEWIWRLGALPLMHQPGERWMYNTCADVLGVLIARAADQDFDEFLRDRIFDPLGMADTAFSVPAEKLSRLVDGYGSDPVTGDVNVYDPAVGGEWSAPPAFPGGGAGLVSTLDDFAAFVEMMLNDGERDGVRVLSRESVRAMTSDQLSAEQKRATEWGDFFERNSWGYGVSVVTAVGDDAQPLGTYGWDGGLGSAWRSNQRDETFSILLTQQAWKSPSPPQICRDFWDAAHAAGD